MSIEELTQKIKSEECLELLDRVSMHLEELLFLEDKSVTDEQVILSYRLGQIYRYLNLIKVDNIESMWMFIKNKLPNEIRYQDDRFKVNICYRTNEIMLFIEDKYDCSYLSTNAFICPNDNKEYYFNTMYHDYNDKNVSISLASNKM